MGWKFRKKKGSQETTVQVEAKEGGIQKIFVKAQTPEKALELFKELKKEAK